MSNNRNNRKISRNRRGIVLLVTLILLTVLATLGYTLTSRVSAQRHRNQYIIDYSRARYGCDSAIRYAVATLEDLDPQLVSRPNEPDFSDLFSLDDAGYQELLAEWSLWDESGKSGAGGASSETADPDGAGEAGAKDSKKGGFGGADLTSVRGPYGAPWPCVTQPVEFDVGSAKVRIEIEDENAKYPLGWAMLDDVQIKREIDAGFTTFCEMARMDTEQIGLLTEQLAQVAQIKPFKQEFKAITKTVKVPVNPSSSGTSRGTRAPQTKTYRKPISASQQASDQTEYFAKMLHSSLVDTEALARPTVVSETRNESPLQYIGMWGSRKVNINTAPRHVLEAAFIFGGNQVEIAEAIIQLRREKTFATVDELKEALFRFSDSIDKCTDYITTTSRFFTIRVTAVSGTAKASSIVAITKDGDTIRQVAAING